MIEHNLTSNVRDACEGLLAKDFGALTTSCHKVRVATARGSGARHSNRGADIRIRAACMLSEDGK